MAIKRGIDTTARSISLTTLATACFCLASAPGAAQERVARVEVASTGPDPQPQAGPHRVEIGSNDGKCPVDPRVLSIDPCDKVLFVNETGKRVKIKFQLRFWQYHDDKTFVLEPEGSERRKLLTANCDPKLESEYWIKTKNGWPWWGNCPEPERGKPRMIVIGSR
jgi:hypothetical protein